MIFDNYQPSEEYQIKKKEPYKPKPGEIFKTVKKPMVIKKGTKKK